MRGFFRIVPPTEKSLKEVLAIPSRQTFNQPGQYVPKQKWPCCSFLAEAQLQYEIFQTINVIVLRRELHCRKSLPRNRSAFVISKLSRNWDTSRQVRNSELSQDLWRNLRLLSQKPYGVISLKELFELFAWDVNSIWSQASDFVRVAQPPQRKGGAGRIRNTSLLFECESESRPFYRRPRFYTGLL